MDFVVMSEAAEEHSAAGASKNRAGRPLWLWGVFTLMVSGLLAGGYIVIFENPAVSTIRYVARYPDDVMFTGTAVGFFRWRCDSIVAHGSAASPLSIVVGDSRLAVANVTPAALAKLGAVISGSQSETTLWVLDGGEQSLWCDFQGDRLTQLWISSSHSGPRPAAATAPASLRTGQRIGIAWADGATAYLPLEGDELVRQLGRPRDLAKESKIRFLTVP